jgi:anti-anti-sigma factor
MTSITSRITDASATLLVKGRFDFSCHKDFRGAAKKALESKGLKEVQIDLSGVDYIDSAALGMLLLTRENANAMNVSVCLVKPSAIVQQVLDVANFQKIFEIR